MAELTLVQSPPTGDLNWTDGLQQALWATPDRLNVREGYSTKNDSIHMLYWKGPMRRWANFREGVRTFHNSMNAIYTVGRDLPVAPTNHRHLPVYGTHERLDSGDEISVSRAVFQHILGPVQNVAENIGLYVTPQIPWVISFGDCKTGNQVKSMVPDIVMKLCGQDQVRVVGEIKVPWRFNHHLQRAYNLDDWTSLKNFRARHLFGMLHRYSKLEI